jgi:hypothetical protein
MSDDTEWRPQQGVNQQVRATKLQGENQKPLGSQSYDTFFLPKQPGSGGTGFDTRQGKLKQACLGH